MPIKDVAEFACEVRADLLRSRRRSRRWRPHRVGCGSAAAAEMAAANARRPLLRSRRRTRRWRPHRAGCGWTAAAEMAAANARRPLHRAGCGWTAAAEMAAANARRPLRSAAAKFGLSVAEPLVHLRLLEPGLADVPVFVLHLLIASLVPRGEKSARKLLPRSGAPT